MAEVGRAESKKILPSFGKYYGFYNSKLRGQNADSVFEAAVAIDFSYWGFFDQIIGLSEKIGDLNILIDELKYAPYEMSEIQAYLIELDQKYSKPAN